MTFSSIRSAPSRLRRSIKSRVNTAAWLIAALVLLNAAAVYLAAFRHTRSGAKSLPNLASLQINDDVGRPVAHTAATKEWIIVQFINPAIPAHLVYLRDVVAIPLHHSLRWIIVTRNTRRLRAAFPTDPQAMYLVEDESGGLLRRFHATEFLAPWFLYDSDGDVREYGNYQSGVVSSVLKRVVDSDPPLSPMLLVNILRSSDVGGVICGSTQGIRETVALFLSSVNSGCPAAAYMDALDRTSKADTSRRYVIVVPDDFTAYNVAALKQNFDLTVEVIRAPSALSTHWQALNRRYGEVQVNGFVATFERDRVSRVITDPAEIRGALAECMRSTDKSK